MVERAFESATVSGRKPGGHLYLGYLHMTVSLGIVGCCCKEKRKGVGVLLGFSCQINYWELKVSREKKYFLDTDTVTYSVYLSR